MIKYAEQVQNLALVLKFATWDIIVAAHQPGPAVQHTIMPLHYQKNGKLNGCEQAADSRIFLLLNVGLTVVSHY